MSQLHRLLSDHIDASVRDLAAQRVAAPSGWRAAVTRRRRTLALRSGAALGVGALAVGAGVIAWPSPGEPEEAAFPSEIAAPTLTSTEISLFEPAWHEAALYSLRCGDPVPEPTDDNGGFTASFNPLSDLTMTPRPDDAPRWSEPVGGTLSYVGEQLPPVAQDDTLAILARDGQVVAADFGPFDPVWIDRSTGLVNSFSIDPMVAWANLCTDPDDPNLVLEAGEYELYAVHRIHTSTTDLALRELDRAGLSTAGSSDVYLRPGSIDCEGDGDVVFDETPVACEPTALAGGRVNFDAGTVEVPYPAGDYAGDLDVTVVSGPQTFTLTDDVRWPAYFRVHRDADVIESATQFACGVEFDYVGNVARGDQSWVRAEVPAGLFGRLVDDDAVPVRFDVPEAGSAAEIGFGPLDQTWVTVLTGGGTGRERVIGRGTVDLSTGGTVQVDRGRSLAESELSFTDIQWCDGESPTPTIHALYVTGDTVVSGDFGTDTVEVVTIDRSERSWPIGQMES